MGVTHVAVGVEVQMPDYREPKLVWGKGDADLRAFLQELHRLGLQCFLLPRIESPDFFKPPYPFRGDIQFTKVADWSAFHDVTQDMLLHYAKLAAEEKVAMFGLGLELRHSVADHSQRWRQIIAKVREVYAGKLTYSANWYEEWEEVQFWDDLDYIGIGAYFELRPGSHELHSGPASKQVLLERWQPICARIAKVAKHFDRPVLFTEIGYTGYVDCAERPWEWAGKKAKGVAVDLQAQARAVSALMEVARQQPWLHGMFLWRFYTHARWVDEGEYGLQGRPAGAVLDAAYRAR